MTREEHMERAKQRAIEYVDRGEPTEAIASMLSDLGKHPETERTLAWAHTIAPIFGDATDVRKWVEGLH